MNIAALIQLFKALVKQAFDHRNDPQKWEGWIDVHGHEDHPSKIELEGKFKEASVELSGIRFVITIGDKDVVLEGKPGLAHLDIYLDGNLDPEARVKLAGKGTPSHPLRTAVDIRPVTFNGDECRFNLRFRG